MAFGEGWLAGGDIVCRGWCGGGGGYRGSGGGGGDGGGGDGGGLRCGFARGRRGGGQGSLGGSRGRGRGRGRTALGGCRHGYIRLGGSDGRKGQYAARRAIAKRGSHDASPRLSGVLCAVAHGRSLEQGIVSGLGLGAEADVALAGDALHGALADGVAGAAAVGADKVEVEELVRRVAARVVDGEKGCEARGGARGHKRSGIVAEARGKVGGRDGGGGGGGVQESDDGEQDMAARPGHFLKIRPDVKGGGWRRLNRQLLVQASV